MLAAIALGSNLPSRFGGPAENLGEALHRLVDAGEVVRTSRIFETDPVGYLDQPRFCNAAAVVRTEQGPLELLRTLLHVEASMGRLRSPELPAKGPRVIDLDLLLYGDGPGHGLVLDDPELVLPHPAMAKRRFVLEPLVEIAPGWVHPVLGRTVAELLADLGPG